eukprot:Trichotokara_eunicae@DN5367_c0_g1_i10.p1
MTEAKTKSTVAAKKPSFNYSSAIAKVVAAGDARKGTSRQKIKAAVMKEAKIAPDNARVISLINRLLATMVSKSVLVAVKGSYKMPKVEKKPKVVKKKVVVAKKKTVKKVTGEKKVAKKAIDKTAKKVAKKTTVVKPKKVAEKKVVKPKVVKPKVVKPAAKKVTPKATKPAKK